MLNAFVSIAADFLVAHRSHGNGVHVAVDSLNVLAFIEYLIIYIFAHTESDFNGKIYVFSTNDEASFTYFTKCIVKN